VDLGRQRRRRLPGVQRPHTRRPRDLRQAGVIAQTTSGIGLPVGYISGTAIHATSTWFGKTIADMGLVPGTYVWTWGLGREDSDSLTLNIAPEPTTFALASIALLGAVGVRRNRR
jgi:hypothetical protein